MAGVPRELCWPEVREITVTVLLPWLYPSLAGLKQHSGFPQLSISLPMEEDAGSHLNFALSPPFAAAWAKFRCAPALSCAPKARELPKMLKPSKEQQWLCKPSS